MNKTESEKIAYGARCTWWDSKDKIGSHNGLPNCPCCRGMLFEIDNINVWNEQVEAYDKTHPGYKEMISWARGKCFRSLDELEIAYNKRAH